MILSLIRLEFDHSELDYYTELDAVCLVGTFKPFPENSLGLCHTLQNNLTQRKTTESSNRAGLVSVGDITNKIQELNIHHLSPQVRKFIFNSLSSKFL